MATRKVPADYGKNTLEPTGWADRTQTTLAYDESIRTLTLTVGANGATFYSGAIKYTLDANAVITLQHTAVTGNHFFLYNGSTTLQVQTTPWDIASTGVPVAAVYYNATTGKGIAIEERHGIVMDGTTHKYLHETVGTQVISGFDITPTTYAPTIPADADNQISVAQGVIADEDLRLTVTALTGGTNAYRVWYRSGSGATAPWQWDTSSFPYVTGTNAQYNQWTGSAWQKTDLTSGQYANIWVLATSAIDPAHGIICVLGQAVYSSQAGAEQETWDDLILGNTPPWTEFGPLYRVTIGVNDGYTTTGKARIESVTDGQTVLTTVNVSQTVSGQSLYFDTTPSDLTLPSVTGTVYAAVNSNPDTITRSSGSFLTDGFIAGMKITTSGFATGANNGTFTVTNVTATTLTLATIHALTAEAAGATVTIAAYRERLSRAPVSGVEQDQSLSMVLADGDVVIDSYATVAGYPGALVIPAGVWEFRAWSWVSSTGGGTVTTIKFRVLKVSTAGVSTTLFTTAPTTVTATTLGTAQAIVRSHAVSADISLATTDRIVVQIIGNTSTATARVLHFLYQGTSRASYVTTTLGIAGASLPQGGTTGQVLSKKSNSDYDVQWASSSATATSTSTSVTNFNGVLTSAETNVQLALDKLDDHVHPTDTSRAPTASPTFTGTLTAADASITGVLRDTVTANAQTDSYTLVLADRGKMVEMGKATAQTVTVPTNTSVAFPVGTRIDILQTGAGQVTVAGDDGTVTINGTPGLKTRAQWSSASLIKRATNTWVLIGDLAA